MNSRWFGLLLLSLLCSTHGLAVNYTYDFNDNCRRAYHEYLSLHIKEARASLSVEFRTNPQNLLATYIADYEDCIVLLLSCDKTEYHLREGNLERRLDLLDKGDKRNPWYRLCKGGVYLRRAIIELRFGSQYTAARYFHKSFGLLKENQRLFPAFAYNNAFTGLEEAVVGSLPDSYKWVASLFGIKGSVKTGTEKLAAFINTHDPDEPMYPETVLYYLYTRFYLLQEQQEVWDYLSGPHFSTTNNLLNVFIKTNLALDFRKADAAIETLEEATSQPHFQQYPIFDYQMGVALLYKSDTNCNRYFHQYLNKNKSDLYIKDCWQKMALSWYLAGNMMQANQCRQEILHHGTARIDADKQAEKFAEQKYWPVKKLLHARLLIEGGYLNQAMVELNSLNISGLSNPADKIEYLYRCGNVYEESGNESKALEYYQTTIDNGKNRHEQYAARAALQMGKINERSGNLTEALVRYKQSLDMPSHDFQNSIDQQAKAGISRVESKAH